jgi:hypothetical protein
MAAKSEIGFWVVKRRFIAEAIRRFGTVDMVNCTKNSLWRFAVQCAPVLLVATNASFRLR